MKQDTRTFIAAVVGIPLALTGATILHASVQGSLVVIEREEIPVEMPEVASDTETPVIPQPAPIVVPVPVTPKPIPVVVDVPVTPPPPPVEVPVVTPAPAPEPTVVPAPVKKKNSRRSRAS